MHHVMHHALANYRTYAAPQYVAWLSSVATQQTPVAAGYYAHIVTTQPYIRGFNALVHALYPLPAETKLFWYRKLASVALAT